MRGAARFLSPVDKGDENDEIMRAAYDDLLEVGLPLRIVRQGGNDDSDAIAEPSTRLAKQYALSGKRDAGNRNRISGALAQAALPKDCQEATRAFLERNTGGGE